MSSLARPALVMGFSFFPRGGSAQVARYLCRALDGGAWTPQLLSGSLGDISARSNADRFFRGIRCHALDYSPAQAAWDHGDDPMVVAVPMHGSFEDKPDVPDRVFVGLDDDVFVRQVHSWTRHFSEHVRWKPQVVHLHHLTPMHEAARTLWPETPIVTHLHGTELKMLASIRDTTMGADHARLSQRWVARMRRWAAASDRLVVVSAQDRALAVDLLSVDEDRVATIANGVETDLFSPVADSDVGRLASWRRWLVDDPHGWKPDGAEGSIRYDVTDLAAFLDERGAAVPVVVFAGRFLRFKRLSLLIEAHHVARSRTGVRSVLVVVGGFPGEWEGEHPYDTVRRLDAKGVFFLGWRDHHELAEILSCGDVFAAPSVDEPFGLVYLEAMAAGLPPIATTTGGPPSFINVDPSGPTGWLVPPDDLDATAEALVDAVTDVDGRRDRGARAARFVRDRYSWTSAAAALVEIYEDVEADRARAGRSQLVGPTTGVA